MPVSLMYEIGGCFRFENRWHSFVRFGALTGVAVGQDETDQTEYRVGGLQFGIDDDPQPALLFVVNAVETFTAATFLFRIESAGQRSRDPVGLLRTDRFDIDCRRHEYSPSPACRCNGTLGLIGANEGIEIARGDAVLLADTGCFKPSFMYVATNRAYVEIQQLRYFVRRIEVLPSIHSPNIPYYALTVNIKGTDKEY